MEASIFVPGLVNVYKKIWKDPPCYQWVNPLFLWQFSIAMLVYQRVYDVFLEISHKKNYGGTMRYPKIEIERKLLMINGNASMQTGMG